MRTCHINLSKDFTIVMKNDETDDVAFTGCDKTCHIKDVVDDDNNDCSYGNNETR